LWCCSRTVDNSIVIDVVSGITPTHEDIQRLCDTLFDSGSVPNVVVDLSDVEFVSSSFLARLVALNKRIRAADRKLILCGLRPVVREIFRVSRLDTILDIAEDKDTVLTSLRSLRLANALSQILDRESGLTWRRAIPLMTESTAVNLCAPVAAIAGSARG
jgi:anti-anti-sigma factor